MKLFLSFILFLSVFNAQGQTDTKFYPNGEIKSEGEYKDYRIKITYGYDVRRIKKGKWVYYYENGETALKEKYKVRWKKSKPIGVWEYYSTQGDLLKKEYYKRGILKKQEYFTTGTYNYTTDSFKIEPVSIDTMLVTYFLKGKAYGELVANDGTGTYTYFNKARFEIPTPKVVDLLKDTGFYLFDTAQNLIENYSFENLKYEREEGDFEITNLADTFVYGWYMAAGTPDYFRHKKTARFGKKYCGMRLYSNNEYLEYLENHLKKPLEAGKKYCCKVFFKLSYTSGLATDAIGFKFNHRLLKFHYNSQYLPVPDIINKPKQMLVKTKEWMQLTGLYNAYGGEQYFIIGGFKALGAQNKTIVKYKGKEEAYYYIDDIFVWEVAKDDECICNTITVPDSLKNEERRTTERVDTSTYKVGKTFIIKNIFFDTDKAELLPESFKALDSLVATLLDYPTMEIEISGHTDNTGTKERNVELSKERAQAVANYLLTFGVSPSRLNYAGYADTQPIDTNKTKEGRQNNRRVQFKILKL
jgi:outer membrane protein OmpA-like peptidoglycan-associated protein